MGQAVAQPKLAAGNKEKKIDPMGPIGSAAVERVEDGTLFFREHLASSVQFVDLPRLSRPKLSRDLASVGRGRERPTPACPNWNQGLARAPKPSNDIFKIHKSVNRLPTTGSLAIHSFHLGCCGHYILGNRHRTLCNRKRWKRRASLGTSNCGRTMQCMLTDADPVIVE